MVDWGFVTDFFIYAFVIFAALMILGAGYVNKYLESRKHHHTNSLYYRSSRSSGRDYRTVQARQE